ncbi:legumain [Trichonephila clavipes]|uniref:Legumain n=1 Tax=Trichonephila clavipes TaxID=2585209 RepID=A0A8X6UNV4_TRICX|nr:legumain [Trichonephila clavipes]
MHFYIENPGARTEICCSTVCVSPYNSTQSTVEENLIQMSIAVHRWRKRLRSFQMNHNSTYSPMMIVLECRHTDARNMYQYTVLHLLLRFRGDIGFCSYAYLGKEEEVNCKDIIANHLIVENEEFDFDRVRNLRSLETIGINPDNEVPLSDKEILKSFERNTVYTSERYETRLLWKEDCRELKNIPGAFLEIGIVEEDRQFLKFLWIKKGRPNLDFNTHNVETFRYSRVTFGVKCSPFLLAAVIRLHIVKYINKFKRACEMLNELYVDDLINSTSDATEALQLSEEMIHVLVINHPNGNDVYKDVPKDYTGEDVTSKNFIAVLKGDEKTLAGVGSGKVRKSGPSDHVFGYFADHGAPGLIAFPEDELSAMDLNRTINKHVRKNGN